MAAPASPPSAQTPTEAQQVINQPPHDGTFEVDDDDSALGSEFTSDWTSVTSSIYKGVFEHGRRYQALREGEYWSPADDQQFESVANNHLALLLLDQDEENQYFRSPINTEGSQILDIGTGDGAWAIDVADRYPGVIVHGVDLHPPPQTWVTPNCILEVDDVTKPWTWPQKFDLVHIRWLLGSFTDEQWKDVYRKAYTQLKPGGWIEHLDTRVIFKSDDDTIPPGSTMSSWGQMFEDCGKRMGNRLDVGETMKGDIEEAGFVNVHVQDKKIPIGTWPKHPRLKEVGRIQLNGLKLGLEGYAMFLLTHFGAPKPWSVEEVQLLLVQMRKDLDDKKIHSYMNFRRVWAQKPLRTE